MDSNVSPERHNLRDQSLSNNMSVARAPLMCRPKGEDGGICFVGEGRPLVELGGGVVEVKGET